MAERKRNKEKSSIAILEDYFPDIFGQKAQNTLNSLVREGKAQVVPQNPEISVLNLRVNLANKEIPHIDLRLARHIVPLWELQAILQHESGSQLAVFWKGAINGGEPVVSDQVGIDFPGYGKMISVFTGTDEMQLSDGKHHFSDRFSVADPLEGFLEKYQGFEQAKITAVELGEQLGLTYEGYPYKGETGQLVIPKVVRPSSLQNAVRINSAVTYSYSAGK
ncbi:MAG: hypothetical protein ACEQSA_00040 [Weeksellaceae bacterium]